MNGRVCAAGLAAALLSCDGPTDDARHAEALQPHEVVDLFVRDRARAEERYADRPVRVAGYVDAITRVFNDELYLVLSSDKREFRWDVVYCAPAPSMDPTEVEPGQRLRVQGRFEGTHATVVTLTDCTWSPQR